MRSWKQFRQCRYIEQQNIRHVEQSRHYSRGRWSDDYRERLANSDETRGNFIAGVAVRYGLADKIVEASATSAEAQKSTDD